MTASVLMAVLRPMTTHPSFGHKKWPVQFTLSKFDKEVSECLEIMKEDCILGVNSKIEKEDCQFSVWKDVRVYYVMLTLTNQ